MAEPVAPIIALAAHTVAVPVLTIAGVSLGLRADVLLAGFAGSVAAMALLNTVPTSGDTWRELLRTSLRRVSVSIGSAMVAGYITPLFLLIHGIPTSMYLTAAFIIGAGAMKVLPWMLDRFSTKNPQSKGVRK